MRKGLFIIVPIALLVFIDSIFIYKYGTRVASNFNIIVAISVFLFIKFCTIIALINLKTMLAKTFIGILSLIFFIISSMIFFKIDPSQTNVDRWDAVVYWWDGVFAGKFPYSCFTRFKGFPSPLPVLQVICFPFYFLGELGFVIIFSIFTLLSIIQRKYKNTQFTLISLVLIGSSLPIWWEISVRSTLLVNGIIIVLMLHFLLKNFKNDFIKILVCGAVAGLFLSTRVVVAIPLIVFVCYQFASTKDLKSLIIFGTSLLITFLLTLLPLVLFWSLNDLLNFNPINHHEKHMPQVYKIILIMFSVIVGYISKSEKAIYLGVGICLYISATIFVALEVIENGWDVAINKSKADISYFILAFPSLVYVILLQLNENKQCQKSYS